MPSTVILGAPRWSGAPGLLPFRPAVLKYSTHTGQKRIAKSRFRYLVVTKSRRRRADPCTDDHRESPAPSDSLATGLALTLRTRDHTSVESRARYGTGTRGKPSQPAERYPRLQRGNPARRAKRAEAATIRFLPPCASTTAGGSHGEHQPGPLRRRAHRTPQPRRRRRHLARDLVGQGRRQA